MASSKSMRYSSRSSKSSSKSSSVIWVVVGLLVVAILILIFMSNYKFFEKFTNPQPELQYFYMPECGYCKEFSSTWDEISKEVSTNPGNYKFTTKKYDIKDNGEGAALATTLNITGVPTLSLVMADGKTRHSFDLYRTKENILKFAAEKVNANVNVNVK